MRWLMLLFAAGCSTATLRIGGVRIGETTAFVASIEYGPGFGDHHSVQVTGECGIQAGPHVQLTGAVDADYVEELPDVGPIARVGARVRGNNESTALELRSTVFTGMLREKHQGGIGIELAGGVDTRTSRPVFEAAVVFHTREQIF